MRSKTFIALAITSAFALPMTSYSTLDQQQHDYAFASHAAKQNNAYPQHAIQIDEFGGPVNAYTSEELAALAATQPAMELAAVDEQLGSEFISSESSASIGSSASELDLMADSSFDELGGVIGNIDDELSGQSEGMVSNASSRTWYYPDGTVMHESTGGASASVGSSASELDLTAGSSFDELGGVIGSTDDALSGESEEMGAGAPRTTWYFPDGTVIDARTGEGSASAGSSALEFDQLAGPSTTWYYPDGTVIQEGAGEASASAGSSAGELDQVGR